MSDLDELERRIERLEQALDRADATRRESQRILDGIKARHEEQARLDRAKLDAIIEASKLRGERYFTITEPAPPEPPSGLVIGFIIGLLPGLLVAALLVVFA